MGEHEDTGVGAEDGADDGAAPASEGRQATGATEPADATASGEGAEPTEAAGGRSSESQAPAGAEEGAPEGLSPELIAKALRGAIQRKLAEVGLVASADGVMEASGEAVEHLRTGAKRVAVNLMGDLSSQIQRLADAALRPGGPKGGAAMAREIDRQGGEESNVIDLEAARRARGPGPLAEAEQRIAGALREGFNRYLAEHAPAAEDGVPGHVKIDGAFVREHGGRLLASLFGSFASAVVPASVDVATGEGEGATAAPPEAQVDDAPAAEPGEAGDAPAGPVSPEDVRVVEVKLDLPGLFRDLMPPPPK